MCSKENKSHFQQELAVTFSALGKKKSTERPPCLPKAHPLSPGLQGRPEPLFSSLWATGWAGSQRGETSEEENTEMCQAVQARGTEVGTGQGRGLHWVRKNALAADWVFPPAFLIWSLQDTGPAFPSGCSGHYSISHGPGCFPW